ncbi:MAG: hypothetical protein MJ078_01440 [Clostridia bacterium]|nr:hypothetical protein [Clostridia bacterium]
MNVSGVTDKLSLFSDLYRENRDKAGETYRLFERHYAQYKGSKEIDGSCEPAQVVRNVTYELIESQVSTAIPAPKAEPGRYTLKNDRNAKTVERLCARVRDELPFEKMNDLDERYTYIYGGSVWLLEWDNGIVRNGTVGGMKISCLSPMDFVPQYGVQSVEDMDYCFLRFATAKEELEKRYGLTAAETDLLGLPEGVGEDNLAELIVCYYRNEAERVSRFVFSGELTLEDVDDFYARKETVCRRCGKKAALCGCENPEYRVVSREEERISRPIRLSDGETLLPFMPEADDRGNLGMNCTDTAVPFYRPTKFPVVIRKNTSEPGNLFGQSDCEFIRPQQQEINKIESRILQKLMRSGVTPIIPSEAELAPDNSVFGQVIKLREGDSKERYGVLDTTPSIEQDIRQSDRLYEHAKRVLGISDSFMGLSDSTATSGYAKRLQVEQAQGRLESKRKMKQAAYAEMDSIIFSFYLAFADEKRELTYRDAFGKAAGTAFYRYDFLEYDEESGKYVYDDRYLFSVDQNGGVEQQREVLWQKNLENLQTGAYGNPQDPGTLLHYWQCQERAHYPFARENVEYFKAIADRCRVLPCPMPTGKGEEIGETGGLYQELPLQQEDSELQGVGGSLRRGD